MWKIERKFNGKAKKEREAVIAKGEKV